MATSGSYNWSLNRDQAMLMAMVEINALGEQDTVTTLQATNAYINGFLAYKFNGMLKMWSIDGIKAPKRKQGYLFPVYQTANHSLGNSSSASHCTNSYVSTTISADEAALQTVISLTSTTGMTAADNIGIELDAGTRHWTTIVSVDSSTQVTITTAIPTAASASNTVITYTTRLNRPLEVLYGTVIDLKNSNQESPISSMSHDQYLQLPNKSTTGQPNQFYYDKVQAGTNPFYSQFSLYPAPANVHQIVKIVYTDMIQDLDASTDDIDLPQEWFYPVVFNYACELAYSYGKFTELEKLQPKADKMYQLLKDSSSDFENLQISLNQRDY